MRSAVELAIPVWCGSLTQKDKNLIERVQKTSVKLILGASYQNYNQSLEKLKLDSLASRRKQICLKFKKKCTKSQKLNIGLQRKLHYIQEAKAPLSINFSNLLGKQRDMYT